ncbi:MAG TPA: arginine repressor [Sphingomicrobium sp.]|nr:arginine repressor [Sphingomicrobium sp.]
MLHNHAMTDLKERRQRALAELIRSSTFASQEELADRLAAGGFEVTQATISRDLEQIGAVKVRRKGQLSYALADEVRGHVRGGPDPRLAAVFRDWVRSVEPAANLVIIKTPPGSAHLVGVVLDQSEMPEIAGTICGDDTIFIACRGTADALSLSVKLRAELQ